MATQVKISKKGYLFNSKTYKNKGLRTVAINDFLKAAVAETLEQFKAQNVSRLSNERRYSLAYGILDKKTQGKLIPERKLAEYRAKLRSKVKEHIFQSTLAGLETLGQ